MPLFTTNPVVPIIPTPPSITPVPIINTASVYNGDLYRTEGVVPYLDGSPWTCTYYAQCLGIDDVIINSNDTNDPTLKQYLKVNNYELRVTTELSATTDSETGTTSITGTSNVYPFVTPNSGDVFIALIDANTYGVFEVTTPTRQSMFKQSAWSIEYVQIDYLTTNIQDTLDSFVVSTLQFSVTKASAGENPLSTISEYDQSIHKEKLAKEVINGYYLEYYDRLANTFLIPKDINNPTSRRLDQYIVEYWNKLLQPKWSLGYITPKVYEIIIPGLDNPYITILDVIAQQTPHLISKCAKNLIGMTTRAFEIPYLQRTMRASNVDRILTPIKLSKDKINPDLIISGLDPVECLVPYIFTENFYLGTDLSPFESLVYKLINKQTILFTEVEHLLAEVDGLSPIARFYYVPILLTLLLVSR